jgi:hypothetical protein
MRVLNQCVLAFAMISVVGVASVRADFVTYDDFNTPGTPDSAKWSVFSGGAVAPAVGGGNLQMDGAATSAWQGIYSKQSFGYGSFRFSLSSYNNLSACMFAINSQTTDSPASVDEISLRNDSGNLITAGGTGKVEMIDYASSVLPASYTFVWHPDLVQVLRDTGEGDTVLYSTTDTSLIPVATDRMRFEVVAYGSGKFNVDSVAYAAVPEPSSVVLTCAAAMALLAYAWRKRK